MKGFERLLSASAPFRDRIMLHSTTTKWWLTSSGFEKRLFFKIYKHKAHVPLHIWVGVLIHSVLGWIQWHSLFRVAMGMGPGAVCFSWCFGWWSPCPPGPLQCTGFLCRCRVNSQSNDESRRKGEKWMRRLGPA